MGLPNLAQRLKSPTALTSVVTRELDPTCSCIRVCVYSVMHGPFADTTDIPISHHAEPCFNVSQFNTVENSDRCCQIGTSSGTRSGRWPVSVDDKRRQSICKGTVRHPVGNLVSLGKFFCVDCSIIFLATSSKAGTNTEYLHCFPLTVILDFARIRHLEHHAHQI